MTRRVDYVDYFVFFFRKRRMEEVVGLSLPVDCAFETAETAEYRRDLS